MLPKKGPVWTGQRNARRGPRHNYTQVLASSTPQKSLKTIALFMTTSTIICVSLLYVPFLWDKILLRSALPRSNSLMSSCSTKQGVLSRISIVMFAHQQNMIVFTVWSTKYGSAGLHTANKMFTNETKWVLELFKSGW